MYNFLFHRVHPTRDPLWDPMDPVLFERCICYISKKFRVVQLEEYFEQGDFSNHKNVATILFDDGYLDNYQYAEPILAKYNVRASFYIVTDCIDQNVPTWTHILEHLFQHTNSQDLHLNFKDLPQEWKLQKFGSSAERLSFAKKLKPYLKKLPHDVREEILDSIKSQFSDVKLPELMMTWEQINDLFRKGHYIGSHTVTHAMLGTIADPEAISKELLNSGNRIKEKLGYFPKSISYPVGSYNDLTIKKSVEAGYLLGLAVHQNIHDPIDDSPFEIKRIELYNEPWWKTKMRILNRLELLKKILRYK